MNGALVAMLIVALVAICLLLGRVERLEREKDKP
jgi:hypothetical protein